jgi:poly(A) polymerase
MMNAARRIVRKLRQHGHEALFAGGWVRDFLLNLKPKDIDIATSARPEEVRRLFPRSTPIGARFGVVQVRLYGRAYEVATFRSDAVYYDGRHPSSVSFSGPKEDALRRDFTINALFFDPEKERLIDYVKGQSDLKNRKIRTVGDPRERFNEDKLRMLRAVRFACNLEFSITAKTWKAIREMSPGILQVSGERIRDELTGILIGPAPDAGFRMLHESGLLKHILPEVESMNGSFPYPVSCGDRLQQTQKALSLLHPPSVEAAFGVLLHQVCAPGKTRALSGEDFEPGWKTVEKICRRLRMPGERIKRIVDLVRTMPRFFKVKGMRESALKRLLRKPYIDDHLELHRVVALSSDRPLDCYRFCRKKLIEFKHQLHAPPLINGEDLISAGYKPGPLFTKILRTVEDLQLDGVLNTRKEALRHVKKTYPLR